MSPKTNKKTNWHPQCTPVYDVSQFPAGQFDLFAHCIIMSVTFQGPRNNDFIIFINIESFHELRK